MQEGDAWRESRYQQLEPRGQRGDIDDGERKAGELSWIERLVVTCFDQVGEKLISQDVDVDVEMLGDVLQCHPCHPSIF